MIKTLVLHLGDTKTGSTAIQSVLQRGGVQLAGGGEICYPGQSLNHNRLPHTLERGGKADSRAKVFAAIGKELRESDAQYGIVSAEHFQVVAPKVLHEALQEFWPDLIGDLRLVSYVRPHCEKLVSAYSEQAKFGNINGDLKTFHRHLSRKKKLHYAPRFAAWREIFGARFTLRPFVRAHLEQGDAVADFFATITGQSGTRFEAPSLSNASLSAGQIGLLRRLHTLMPPIKNKKRQGKMRASISRAVVSELRASGLGADTGRVTLPPVLARQLAKTYRADARALDEMFFKDSPISQALETISPQLIGTNKGFDAAQHFNAETLLAFDAMAGLICKMAGSKPKVLRNLMTEVRRQTNREDAAES